RLGGAVERLLEPGRGDQLHRPRDLADVADRLAAIDEGTGFGHGLFLALSRFPGSPALQPALERRLTFALGLAEQQVANANALVQVGPVDPFAAAEQSPFLSLLHRAVPQAWVPAQRDDNGPAIRQIDRDFLVADADIDGLGLFTY